MMNTIIQNGLIYDGLGGEPFYGDLWICGDRVAALTKGSLPESIADREDNEIIDAAGKVVTPGFVDIHRHADKEPFEAFAGHSDYGEVLLRQGITTEINGNCGISMIPLNPDPDVRKEARDYYVPVLGITDSYEHLTDYASYMEALSVTPLPVNTGMLIGMGSVRQAVRGFSEGRLTPEEICRCREIVLDALKCGAPGVSIGLMYLPEVYETADELGEILKPLGEYDRLLTTHIRGEGDSLVQSIDEVIQVARIAGCRLEISHFKSCGLMNWRREVYKAIEHIEKAQREGIRVTCDFYPYDCGSTTLLSLIPPDYIQGSISRMLLRLQSAEGRRDLRTALSRIYEDWDNYVISLGWDKVIISAVHTPELAWTIGLSVPEIVEKGKYADEVDAVSDLLVKESGTAAIIIRSMDAEDVDTIARLPYSCLISDAIYAPTDRPHPRMYGAFPHFLHDFAVVRGIVSISRAIQMMSFEPAVRMQIRDRGFLKEGAYADINVFNLGAFTDQSEYSDPGKLAAGLSYCFLNGRLVVKEDKVLVRNAGVLIRA